MTANIIRHQCDYGRVARRRRATPKIMEYRQQLTRMVSKPWNIGRMQRQTKAALENGACYATIPLSIIPIWGISD